MGFEQLWPRGGFQRTFFVLAVQGALHRIIRTVGQQAIQVQRATGFRTGAGQAFATKWLHADHGADHVAVNVQVAHLGAFGHAGDGFINTGVNAQRQTITGGVDLIDQRLQIGALEADHVQHRAEDLFLQLVEAVQFDQGWLDKGATGPLFLILHVAFRGLIDLTALGAHRLNMTFDAGFGLGVDHRPDIGRQAFRVAHAAFGHRAAQHLQRVFRHVFLNAQDTQGGAALACAVECGGDHVSHYLFGQCGRVDDHGVQTTGFGNQRRWTTLRIQTACDAALQDTGNVGRAGKHHAANPSVINQNRADAFALTRQQLQHALRNAGFQQNAHRLCGDQRGLLCRFGQNAVACRKRSGNLAGEDGQREVPRADTHHRAQRTVAVIGEIIAHLTGVVMQEVDCFAHFGDGVVKGFARFAHQNAQQALQLAFHQFGGALKNGGALGRRGGKPDWTGGSGGVERPADFTFGGFTHITDHVARLGRVNDRLLHALIQLGVNNRLCAPGLSSAGQQCAGQRRQTLFVRQVQAAGVDALGAIEFTRQRNAWVRQSKLTLAGGQGFNRGDRIGNQFVERQGGIGDTVNERGVSAVFQQATYQIRQQRFMGADRCIDATWTVQLTVGHFTHHLFVQRFAHAVQALELILARIIVVARQMINRAQGMGVMGRELRINQVRHRQQFAGAGQVGNVGVDLAGVNRIAFQPVHLGAFDFAVPVGAFHQTDHQATAAALCHVDDCIDGERAAFLIGLDHKADTVPTGQLRFEAQLFQQVERDFQAIGFFSVDIDTDVVLARLQGQ